MKEKKENVKKSSIKKDRLKRNKRTISFQLFLSPEESRKLTKLANMDSSFNKSYILREAINIMYYDIYKLNK